MLLAVAGTGDAGSGHTSLVALAAHTGSQKRPVACSPALGAPHPSQSAAATASHTAEAVMDCRRGVLAAKSDEDEHATKRTWYGRLRLMGTGKSMGILYCHANPNEAYLTAAEGGFAENLHTSHRRQFCNGGMPSVRALSNGVTGVRKSNCETAARKSQLPEYSSHRSPISVQARTYHDTEHRPT